MLIEKIDVMIVFEHVSRELEMCFNLKVELEKLGLKVKIVPLHFNRYLNRLIYKPKLVVLPFLYDKNDTSLKDIRNIYGDNIIGLNLHHEQFYNDETKDAVMPSDDYSRKVYHLSWTKQFETDLIQYGVDKELIQTLSNPRFDSYYLRSSINLNSYTEGCNEVIFIPTTFSWAFVDEDYFLSQASIDYDEFQITKKVTENTARCYFNDLVKLSHLHKDKLFVVRPHPYESIDNFRSKFFEFTNIKELPKNISINRDGNVYDWIQHACLVIGWCTTTTMEATMCKKSSIIYHPTEYPDSMNLSFFNYYEIINNFDDLNRVVSNPKDFILSDDTRLKISEEYGFPLEPVTPKLASWIKNIINNNDVIFKTSTLGFSRNFFNLYKDIIKFFLYKFKMLHLLNKNYNGLYEDCLSNKKIESKFYLFKGNKKV